MGLQNGGFPGLNPGFRAIEAGDHTAIRPLNHHGTAEFAVLAQGLLTMAAKLTRRSDFLTGFVASDQAVWARPVGLAVMHDGSLLISEDGNGTIWRVAYRPVR